MATTSITAALKAKYEALAPGRFPGGALAPVFFGEAPTVVDGLQLRPPYVVFSEQAHPLRVLDFEGNTLAPVVVVLEVYAGALGDVDAMCDAIRFNGGGVREGLGFDHGRLPALGGFRSVHQLVPLAEPRHLEGARDRDGARVHAAVMSYRLTVLERA